MPSGDAAAGSFGTTGFLVLSGTGIDSNLNYDPALLGSAYSFTSDSGDFTLVEPKTITSYTESFNPKGQLDVGSMTSSAQFNNDFGKLGVYYSVTYAGSLDYPLAGEGGASVISQDMVSLVWSKGGIAPVLDDPTLKFNWNIEGQLGYSTSDPKGTFGGSVTLEAGLNTAPGSLHLVYAREQ